MARIQAWSDEWVRRRPHPPSGEVVLPDPTIAGHRLVVLRTKKVFEVQRDRPKRFGERKTFKIQVGDALFVTVEQARKRAIDILGQIAKGEDPRVNRSNQPPISTLGSAWAEYKTRRDVRPRTLEMYEGAYERCLKPWANMALATLVDSPALVRDEHRKITEERGARSANTAMTLLRSIYRNAAKLDTRLSRVRHPCEAVEWNDERPRQNAAVPSELMPTWAAQLEKLRVTSPLRASFHLLSLRLGTRPGELAARSWSEIDWDRKILTAPETKTHLVEVPLSIQCIAELERTRAVGQVLYSGSPFVFPARDGGHLARFTEEKSVLSHSGNQMRHSHHTIGVLLGIDELVLDVIEGRSLLKVGAAGTASSAGRGYLDRLSLGPKARVAQQHISDEIDRLMQLDFVA